jgi:hypothetical protein
MMDEIIIDQKTDTKVLNWISRVQANDKTIQMLSSANERTREKMWAELALKYKLDITKLWTLTQVHGKKDTWAISQDHDKEDVTSSYIKRYIQELVDEKRKKEKKG